jgi:hypothetical protein
MRKIRKWLGWILIVIGVLYSGVGVNDSVVLLKMHFKYDLSLVRAGLPYCLFMATIGLVVAGVGEILRRRSK